MGYHADGLGPGNVTVTPESGRVGEGCSRRDTGDESLFVGDQSSKVALDLDAVPELVRLSEESAKAD